MVFRGVFLPEDSTDQDVHVALESWQSVVALGSGTYVNFQGSATAEDLTLAYPPETLGRLTEVRRAYDPDNVFAGNLNIEPQSDRRVAV